MSSIRLKRSLAVLGIMACLAAATAEEAQPFAPLPPAFSPWSPLDSLPLFSTESQSFAGRSESPSLTGNRGAAIEWGTTLIGAGPASAEASASAKDILRLILDPSVFGGYAGKNIFGGISAAAGAAFFEPGKPGLFFASDAVVEYLRGDEAASELGGRATLAAGMAGSMPFPWALSVKALAGDSATDSHAEILAEAATPPAELGEIGLYRLAAASGFSLSSQPGYRSAIFFRSSFEYEGRTYSGGLPMGAAARANAEASWSLETGAVTSAAGASIMGALRFGDKAGLSGRAGFRYDGLGKDDWEIFLRLPEAAASLSGDLGLSASCELPILFARGRLFMRENSHVEFFLKPYVEALLLRTIGSGWFTAGNLHGDAGIELALCVDADRRDVLRAGAGFDFSSWMQGAGGFPGSSDLGLYMVFTIAM
ncbi:MAG: hypothetical protein Q8O15_11500 [Rectinemataceae bacterium]|nr:hypothetical protein [Rectinemataceae bacterium]